MTKQKLNIELFKKVRDRIAAIPESYDQQTYCRKSDRAPCGTVCCIAGEVIICSAPTVEDGIAELYNAAEKYLGVPTRAARLLGLIGPRGKYEDLAPSHPARRLFNESPHNRWPEPFAGHWLKADGCKEEAAIAVAYLDHIISSGKVLE